MLEIKQSAAAVLDCVVVGEPDEVLSFVYDRGMIVVGTPTTEPGIGIPEPYCQRPLTAIKVFLYSESSVTLYQEWCAISCVLQAPMVGQLLRATPTGYTAAELRDMLVTLHIRIRMKGTPTEVRAALLERGLGGMITGVVPDAGQVCEAEIVMGEGPLADTLRRLAEVLLWQQADKRLVKVTVRRIDLSRMTQMTQHMN